MRVRKPSGPDIDLQNLVTWTRGTLTATGPLFSRNFISTDVKAIKGSEYGTFLNSVREACASSDHCMRSKSYMIAVQSATLKSELRSLRCSVFANVRISCSFPSGLELEIQ